jgi:hypothetical protein
VTSWYLGLAARMRAAPPLLPLTARATAQDYFHPSSRLTPLCDVPDPKGLRQVFFFVFCSAWLCN